MVDLQFFNPRGHITDYILYQNAWKNILIVKNYNTVGQMLEKQENIKNKKICVK